MKQIVAFDFDGTITNRDTLLEFIKFAKGKTAFYLGFLLHLPWLLDEVSPLSQLEDQADDFLLFF